jgi:PAS domain S-box-containing protein
MTFPASGKHLLAPGLVSAGPGQAEHELYSVNARLEHALEAAEIGVWNWYVETNRLMASPMAQTLLGYRQGEFVEDMSSYWARLHPDDREWVEAAVRGLLQGDTERRGSSWEEDIEHRIVLPAGDVRWMLVKGRIARDAHGRPVSLSGTILDVTARKRDEWATRLLADASASMASLDAAECLRGVTRAIANRFADWVLVHVRDLDGAVLTEVAASRHIVPLTRIVVRDLWLEYVAEGIAAHKEPIHSLGFADELGAPGPEATAVSLSLHDALDARSWMALPLEVGGREVGAITVTRSRSRGARFDERDQDTFAEVVHRISSRLENAFLFRAEQRQRARFQALVEATANVVWTTDVGGATRKGANAQPRFMGVPVQEIIGTGGTTAVHPDDHERAETAWREAVVSGTLFEQELRVRRADSDYHWAVVRATPVRDVDGTVIEWVGITEDVQGQHEVRARLEESEASYRRIVETANEGILTLDRDGCFTFANRRMAEMLDTTVEDLGGRSIFEFQYPEDVEAGREALRQRLAGRSTPATEVRLRSLLGREVWTRRAATPLIGPSGRVEGSLAFVTDITETKRAERYRARYELLARHANDTVLFIRRSDGRLLEVNEAALKSYGYSHAELLALTVFDLRAPESRHQLASQLPQVTSDGFFCQTTHIRKDGTRFPVEVSARATELEGEPVILSVIRDITRRRRAEEEREQNERFRDLFVGMLGHDLRNPLSAVLTGTSLALRRSELSEADAWTLRRVHTAGQRMARMIEQLLDFTRTRHGGGIPVLREPVDLREILVHVVDELGSANPEAVIELEHSGATDGAWDGDRLAQVFSNLIHNALQYGHGEPVRVSVRGADGEVVVRVHNGGDPIDPALLPAIFDPFRRAERRGMDKKSGLGLGLYISQQIVAAHGGMICVESMAGEGTTFEVTIPRGL